VSAVVLLNTTPLGLLANPRHPPEVVACRRWATALRAAGRRIIVPEITDYEVRRELIRAKKTRSLALLDALAGMFEYLPLTTVAMRKAAELWAQARQQGQQTAADAALDADVILAGQALTLAVPNFVVATTNVGHLSRFVPAEAWHNIVP